MGFTSPSPPTARPPASSPAPSLDVDGRNPPPINSQPEVMLVSATKSDVLRELETTVQATPPAGRRQLVGEWTYAAVVGMPNVTDPAKITGMLIDLPIEQLLPLLADPQQLAPAVAQAVSALQSVGEAPSPPPQQASMPPGTMLSTEDRKPGWVQREVLSRPKPPPKAPPTNAKTRLCKYWVQRGHCMQGDKCTFAHGMPDMVEMAQQCVITKVEAGMAKKGARTTSLGFMPLQAMARKPKARSTKEKPTSPQRAQSESTFVDPSQAAASGSTQVNKSEVASATGSVDAPSDSLLSLEELFSIQAEAMADDVAIDLERMRMWTRQQAMEYFESGGTRDPAD